MKPLFSSSPKLPVPLLALAQPALLSITVMVSVSLLSAQLPMLPALTNSWSAATPEVLFT